MCGFDEENFIPVDVDNVTDPRLLKAIESIRAKWKFTGDVPIKFEVQWSQSKLFSDDLFVTGAFGRTELYHF
ncbi:hypothetical protein EVG64_15555 [Salmonella enterica subsp. enterica serovar Corvallis]|nr:hypothetical protein [Salmonella enterica subsp. enterica serovar Corvallis]ECE8036706.1 hypothetical protein [Salmonella enterica subsp. enterica serovar Corvallis]